MKKFRVGVQIGFFSEPYEYYEVWAHSEQDALARVDGMLPPYVGNRFLSIVDE